MHTCWQACPFGQMSRYTDSVLPLIGKIGTLLSAAHLRETETHEFPHCTAEAVAAVAGPHLAAGAAAAAEALAVTVAVAEALAALQVPFSIGFQVLSWSRHM